MDVCVTLNSNTDGLGWGLSQRPVSLTFLMVMLPYVHRRKLMTGIIKMPVIEVFRVYLTVFPGQVLSRNARPAEKSLKVLGKSVGLCKTAKRKDQLYIRLLGSVLRIICENFNPNGLLLARL